MRETWKGSHCMKEALECCHQNLSPVNFIAFKVIGKWIPRFSRRWLWKCSPLCNVITYLLTLNEGSGNYVELCPWFILDMVPQSQGPVSKNLSWQLWSLSLWLVSGSSILKIRKHGGKISSCFLEYYELERYLMNINYTYLLYHMQKHFNWYDKFLGVLLNWKSF
jgi:hypothetical protein